MSPEPAAHSISRRGLRIAAVVAVAIAALVVGVGITGRASSSTHLRQWTDAQGPARRDGHAAAAQRQLLRAGTARPPGGLLASADLRARQWLSEGLEARYRQPGPGWTAARRNRGTGSGSTVVPGPGRSDDRASQCGARDDHGRALGAATEDRFGVASGGRHEERRLPRQ